MINFGHETEELEFKKSTSEMHDAMKDIVAILNKHEKGILYFGVAPNGDVKGLQVVESTLRDVSRVIFESIKPQIYPQIQKVIQQCRLWEHSEPTTLEPLVSIISFITSIGVSTAHQISDKILYQLSDCQTMLPTLSRQSVTICIRQFHYDFSLSDCFNFFLLFFAPTHAFHLSFIFLYINPEVDH